MRDTDRRAPSQSARVARTPRPLDPLYKRLPRKAQRLQLWGEAVPDLDGAEDSQREWSTESFALLHATPQAGLLGAIPLFVLTRAQGGYADTLDAPAAEFDQERRQGQARLLLLSTNSKQLILQCGHNMEIEAPDAVAAAIRDVVEALRNHSVPPPTPSGLTASTNCAARQHTDARLTQAHPRSSRRITADPSTSGGTADPGISLVYPSRCDKPHDFSAVGHHLARAGAILPVMPIHSPSLRG
jgi:hypothetical protein